MSQTQSRLFELMAENDAQGREARALLLDARTVLFCQHDWHNAYEIEEFGTLAAGLLADVDEESAIAHARMILPRSDCPPAIIRALMSRNDGARAVAIELARDTQEPDIAIALIAAAADVMAQETPAAPGHDGHAMPSPDDDRRDAIARIRDASAPISMAEQAQLLAQGRRDRIIARALIEHRALGASERGILFLWSTPAERRDTIARLAALSRLDPASLRPAAEIASIAQLLELNAARRDSGAFTMALCDVTGADRAIANDIAGEPSAEPLTITLHALGLDQAEIIRIIALRRGQGAMPHLSFDGVLGLLRGLEPAISRRLFALFSGAPLASRARIAPQGPVPEGRGLLDRLRRHASGKAVPVSHPDTSKAG